MDYKALLKTLQDDLAATRRSHEIVTAQINAEEVKYWATGDPGWIDRNKQSAILNAADTLICRNEETMKAWFDSVN